VIGRLGDEDVGGEAAPVREEAHVDVLADVINRHDDVHDVRVAEPRQSDERAECPSGVVG
jgi:hypothetical protein